MDCDILKKAIYPPQTLLWVTCMKGVKKTMIMALPSHRDHKFILGRGWVICRGQLYLTQNAEGCNVHI